MSIIAYDDQKPYRGGFMRTRIQVFSPAGGGGGAAVVTVPPPTSFGVQSLSHNEVSLDWNAATGATGHLLEVATDAAFSNLIIYREPVELELDTVAGLTPATVYHARLSTFVGYQKSAPCAAITFTTSPAP